MPDTTFKFKMKNFEKVIKQHNANKATLAKWRKDFADPVISKELAKFAKKAFPMIPGTVDDLTDCFSLKTTLAASNQKAFEPWNGKWKGQWKGQWKDDEGPTSSSNQYHIWDDTVPYGAQHIQPVTQSTSVFFDSQKFKEYADKNKSLDTSLEVDLGINVWSQKNGNQGGLTGWVSKRQGKQHDKKRRKEMPHIAYLYKNQNTLIWIAQIWVEGTKSNDNSYYMFYETANSNSYAIQGQNFTIGSDKKITGFKIGSAGYMKQ